MIDVLWKRHYVTGLKVSNMNPPENWYACARKTQYLARDESVSRRL